MQVLRRSVILLLLSGLLLAGCASTSLQGVWKDPQYSGPPFRKLLVVGITKDGQVRRSFEDIFSAQLRARGVQAVPGYTVIGGDKADETALAEAVKKSGADGVITTRLVAIDTRTGVSPGYVTYFGAPVYPYGYYPAPHAGATLYGYYANTWAVYQPPTSYTYEEATLESNLFEAGSGRLVWAGTTVTFDTKATAKASADLAGLVIEALAKDKLI
jgi:hypothetical protein